MSIFFEFESTLSNGLNMLKYMQTNILSTSSEQERENKDQRQKQKAFISGLKKKTHISPHMYKIPSSSSCIKGFYLFLFFQLS